MHEWPHGVRDAARAAPATCEGLLANSAGQSRRTFDAEQCTGPQYALAAAGRRRRKARQDVSIRLKKQIVRLRDANASWPVVLRQLPIPVSRRNAQKIMGEAAIYRSMPDDSQTLGRSSRRAGKWPELDALVDEWYLAIYALGHRRIPITTALLQEGATMIAAQRGITGFSASHGWVQGFLKRLDICNVATHGQAGEVNLALAASAMQDIRHALETYPPERI